MPPIVPSSFESPNCTGVPPHIRSAIARYINHGDPVGGFLTAFLDNDLKEAFARADDDNQKHMLDIVRWFYNHAPNMCWGSPERVRAWQAQGGALGPREAALEVAGERVRKMIPAMSVWFPSVDQGEEIARAAILAFLETVDVDALIRPTLEAQVRDDEGAMPSLAEIMAEQYSGENKTQTTMRAALSEALAALARMAEPQ